MPDASEGWLRSPRLAGAVLLILTLISPRQALAEPQADPGDGPVMSGQKLKWRYPEFSTTEWVVTGLFGALALGMQLVNPLETKLKGGLAFDDAARDALVVEDLEDQRTVRSVSDALLTVITAYPFLVDSLVVAAWYRRSPAVAWQMAQINLQTMAVTLGITSVVKIAVSRERPYSDTCGAERSETLRDCEGDRRYVSFFSGHSSMAFASAGLICMHHIYLDLYNNGVADAGTCAGALGVAAATGLLRVVGDQHYMSDVLIGAAVGTITGFGLPYVLHYQYGKRGRARARDGGAVDAQLVPLANGMAITGIFDETGDLESDTSAPDTLRRADAAPAGNPWRQGQVRPFLSTRVDIGFIFLKPRVSVGYGRPHDVWIGLDVNPLISFEGIGAWGGLRGTLGWLDLRLGARYQYTFSRSFLAPKGSYNKDDIEDRAGPSSSYLSLEAELTTSFPLGPGSLSSELAITYITGVEPGFNVYEETIKVVAAPPWIWRGRLSYLFPLDREKVFKVGLTAEIVGVPGREVYTLRGGLLASVRLMRSLEARLTFMPVWHSEDDLGSAGSDLLLVGVRHRWATGVPVLQ